jgi:uncharacterized protein (UPF0305 family)
MSDQKQRYLNVIKQEFPSVDVELINEVYDLAESHGQFLHALLDAEAIQALLECLVENINEKKTERRK